jgi:hypothetical protein
MKSLVVSAPDARARGIEFIPDALVVHLEDGRSLSVPLEWFPRPREATPEARNRWELIGRALGMHWPAHTSESAQLREVPLPSRRGRRSNFA